MVGGSGKNNFFYLVGDGNDTISNAQSGDVVELLNVNLSDIDVAGTIENSKGSNIEIKFNDGGSLVVEGGSLGDLSGVSFKTANDGTWNRKSDGSWSKK